MKYSDLSAAEQRAIKQEMTQAAMNGASCNELDQMLRELLKAYSASEGN